ncbi:hypothetical protein UT300016_23190 [Clostridium senegalense]
MIYYQRTSYKNRMINLRKLKYNLNFSYTYNTKLNVIICIKLLYYISNTKITYSLIEIDGKI